MANNDRARKLLVRSALVTSATIATFIGAQNLAMLDQSQLDLTLTPVSAPTASATALISPSPEAATSVPVQHVAPQLIIQRAPPSIVILRHFGQQTSTTSTTPAVSVPSTTVQASAAAVVSPPVPAQISVPNPVIVQQPIMQVGRSSR